MKIRNLDSIYIRVQIEGKWESRCLTDCPWPDVEKWLTDLYAERGLEPVLHVTKHLHESLRTLGDNFASHLRIIVARCHHGQALRNYAGELLEPPCGCRLSITS